MKYPCRFSTPTGMIKKSFGHSWLFFKQMKTSITITAFVILLLLAAFPGKLNSQNMILAGQTEGEYIHYTDYEPDSMAVLTEYIDHFDLDIDLDQIPDVGFYVKANDNIVWIRFWSYIKIYNDNVEVARTSGNYALELSYGDIIDNNTSWTGDSLSSLVFMGYYEGYEPPYDTSFYYGEFESGYVGFKIENPWETYYGWINLDVESGPGVAEVTAMSSAFYSVTIGLNEYLLTNEILKIFPNPCQDKFTIQISEMNGDICRFHIFDINGRKIADGKITGQSTEIDVSDINPGVYFVEVQDGSNTIRRKKLIVR